MSTLTSFVRLTLMVSLLIAASGITYNVYPVASPSCDPAKALRPGFELPESAPIGSCHRVSEGENTYRNIQVISCSARCLCFTQVRSFQTNSAPLCPHLNILLSYLALAESQLALTHAESHVSNSSVFSVRIRTFRSWLRRNFGE